MTEPHGTQLLRLSSLPSLLFVSLTIFSPACGAPPLIHRSEVESGWYLSSWDMNDRVAILLTVPLSVNGLCQGQREHFDVGARCGRSTPTE